MLVGAGGHFGPVGRYLGKSVCTSSVLAQEIEFEVEPAQAAQLKVAGEIPELFFCRDLRGYGWVFRKDNYLNVGLGRTDSHEISRHVKDFVGYLAKTRAVETPAGGIAGHAYGLIGHSHRKILDGGVLLIGDAAGLAYPESGEGIRPAIESGLIAAHAILNAEGDYSAKKLALYRELLNFELAARTLAPRHAFANAAACCQRIAWTAAFAQPRLLPERGDGRMVSAGG